MTKYESMVCPNCGAQMRIKGKWKVCDHCETKMKRESKKNIRHYTTYNIDNSYHDNRSYHYKNSSGMWNALSNFFTSDNFVLLFPFLIILIVVIQMNVSDFLTRDERAAKKEAELLQQQQYEEYVLSVPHNTVPILLNEAVGSNYEDVVNLYESAGFTNISTVETSPEKLADKIKTPDDSVMNLTVDGSRPTANKNYPLDVPVIVYYYNKW